MREDQETRVEFHFDCIAAGTGIERSEIPDLHHLRVESFSAELAKTSSGAVTIPNGHGALCFNEVGTLLIRPNQKDGVLLATPHTAIFARGPAKLAIQVARGQHFLWVLSWPNALLPLVDNWILNKSQDRSRLGVHPTMGTHPMVPDFQEIRTKFGKAIESEPDLIEPLIVGMLYESIVTILNNTDTINLTPMPAEIPATISELVKAVAANPENSWPLKEAADMAGYSPFHFSRVFKSLVSYGFHEYVDRKRTEKAVGLLCESDNPVDVVASSSGFGTTQGLRESIKEYLGLVPSELRTSPGVFDPVEAKYR